MAERDGFTTVLELQTVAMHGTENINESVPGA